MKIESEKEQKNDEMQKQSRNIYRSQRMVGRKHLHGDIRNFSFYSLLDQIPHEGPVILGWNPVQADPHAVLLISGEGVHEAISMVLQRLNPVL